MKRRHVVLLLILLLIIAMFFILRGCRDAGPLLYVRLDDKSSQSLSTDYPGSDIDAIEIVRNGKVVGTATAVVDSQLLDGAPGNTNKFKDLKELLGIANYDAENRDNYVALGGKGAYVIVKMSVPLQPGDTVRVHEIGAGTGGSAEPCSVAIGRNESGPFRVIGKGAGPFEVVVPAAVD
jgi:hypothetical protein